MIFLGSGYFSKPQISKQAIIFGSVKGTPREDAENNWHARYASYSEKVAGDGPLLYPFQNYIGRSKQATGRLKFQLNEQQEKWLQSQNELGTGLQAVAQNSSRSLKASIIFE